LGGLNWKEEFAEDFGFVPAISLKWTKQHEKFQKA
jgi:hypothetical protein